MDTWMSGLDPQLVRINLKSKKKFDRSNKPHATSSKLKVRIKQEIEKLFYAGYIKPIHHPAWLSIIVPTKKKMDKFVAA